MRNSKLIAAKGILMRLKTVVDETFEGGNVYKSWCRTDASEKYREMKLTLAELEYEDAFAETISRDAAQYHLHTVFTYDYESSSDAGDGRDDYYKEETDEQVDPAACIVKDGQFVGVICECFGVQGFVPKDSPETIINHPKNYGGRNYHFYRDKRFKLLKNNG